MNHNRSVVVKALVVLMLVAGQHGLGLASPDKPVFGYSAMSFYNPFFLALRDGIEEVLAPVGGKLLVHDARHDNARQIEGIEQFIEKRVDAILLTALDATGIIPAVQTAHDAGIPVVAVDTGVAGDLVATFVASDNLSAGKLCGEYVVERLQQINGKAAGKVVILDGHPATSVLHRVQGFREVINNYPDIEVVASGNGMGNITESLKIMEKILERHEKIDAVFAINDPSGIGALQAIEAVGREDEMFVVGVDGAKIALEAIKRKSAFVFTASQDPVTIGRIGAEMTLKVIIGEAVEPVILVPVQPVSIENVDEYLKNVKF